MNVKSRAPATFVERATSAAERTGTAVRMDANSTKAEICFKDIFVLLVMRVGVRAMGEIPVRALEVEVALEVAVLRAIWDPGLHGPKGVLPGTF